MPVNDHYFLGRMDFQRGVAFRSFLPQPGLAHRTLKGITGQITQLYSMPYQAGEFTYMIVIDASRFDRQHYQLDFVSREFLGNVRCVVFDVQPRPGTGVGLFEGRIWAEEQEYNIVRFNGTYTPAYSCSASTQRSDRCSSAPRVRWAATSSAVVGCLLGLGTEVLFTGPAGPPPTSLGTRG